MFLILRNYNTFHSKRLCKTLQFGLEEIAAVSRCGAESNKKNFKNASVRRGPLLYQQEGRKSLRDALGIMKVIPLMSLREIFNSLIDDQHANLPDDPPLIVIFAQCGKGKCI